MEWPPRSGNTQSFPEVDRAAWFDAETSKTKIHKGQVAIIDLAIGQINNADTEISQISLVPASLTVDSNLFVETHGLL
jgi:predicted NUDIX family NTP pyrophosphohydrolase